MMRYLEQFFYGNMDPQARESIHPEAMRKVQRTLSDLEKMAAGAAGGTSKRAFLSVYRRLERAECPL